MQYLSPTLEARVSFRHHFSEIAGGSLPARWSLTPLRCWKSTLSLGIILLIYNISLSNPHLRYTSLVQRQLNILQNRVLRIILAELWFVKNMQIHQELDFPALSNYTVVLAGETLEGASRAKNPLIQDLLHLYSLNSLNIPTHLIPLIC